MNAQGPIKWLTAGVVLLSAPVLFGATVRVTLAVYHVGDFDNPALGAMRAESSALLRGAGAKLEWVDASTPPAEGIAAEILVVVRMHGACVYHPGNGVQLNRKAYASVHEQRGAILPFVDVDCEKVLSSVSHLLCLEQPLRAQLLLGQALGRVLAHELYHVLAQSSGHTAFGVTKASLSPEELIRDRLTFDHDALEAIRRHLPALAEMASAAIQ